MILFTLSCNEVGEAGISSILCKLLADSGSIRECVVRPFAWPYLRHSPGVEITVRGLPNNFLGVLLGIKLPKDTHLFPMNKILKFLVPKFFLNKTSQDLYQLLIGMHRGHIKHSNYLELQEFNMQAHLQQHQE